jgi:hypothetical protein
MRWDKNLAIGMNDLLNTPSNRLLGHGSHFHDSTPQKTHKDCPNEEAARDGRCTICRSRCPYRTAGQKVGRYYHVDCAFWLGMTESSKDGSLA